MIPWYTALQREVPPLNDTDFLFVRREYGIDNTREFGYFCRSISIYTVRTYWLRNEVDVISFYAFIKYPPAVVHGIYQCLFAWPHQPELFFAHSQAVLYVQFQCKY